MSSGMGLELYSNICSGGTKANDKILAIGNIENGQDCWDGHPNQTMPFICETKSKSLVY